MDTEQSTAKPRKPIPHGPAHKKYKHGESGFYTPDGKKYDRPHFSRLYNAWHHMKDDKSTKMFPEWEQDFRSFRDWAKQNGYSEEDGITHFVRRDRNLGFFPDNIAISPVVTSNRIFLTHNGITMCVADWAKTLGVSKQMLSVRIHSKNWTVDRALTENLPENTSVDID